MDYGSVVFFLSFDWSIGGIVEFFKRDGNWYIGVWEEVLVEVLGEFVEEVWVVGSRWVVVGDEFLVGVDIVFDLDGVLVIIGFDIKVLRNDGWVDVVLVRDVD